MSKLSEFPGLIEVDKHDLIDLPDIVDQTSERDVLGRLRVAGAPRAKRG